MTKKIQRSSRLRMQGRNRKRIRVSKTQRGAWAKALIKDEVQLNATEQGKGIVAKAKAFMKKLVGRKSTRAPMKASRSV